MSKVLTENLRRNDLEYLVSPYVSIDQYTSKIKPDNITIAFFCNQLEVAEDLVDFLEKLYPIEICDIEISDTLTEDNKNIVYVELERNQLFPKVLIDILDSIDFLINVDIKDWDYITFGMSEKDKVSYDSIKEHVRLVPLEIEDQNDSVEVKKADNEKAPEGEVKKESVQYSKDGITRTYLDEGIITREELDRIITESETLNENSLDKEVLEYNFPETEIITTDNNAFIIGKTIRKLGC